MQKKGDEEEKECRQRRNDHIYMRISWFDDAWRSKTEQTAERFFFGLTHYMLRGRVEKKKMEC
jgi:hypothetical protein